MSQPAQQQEPPGTRDEMTPRPDCGEQSYVGHGRLDSKVAVITGGDSGIGRAVAIAYAREGADVVLSYLDGTRMPRTPRSTSSRPAAAPYSSPATSPTRSTAGTSSTPPSTSSAR